jgi:hypothetical protein
MIRSVPVFPVLKSWAMRVPSGDHAARSARLVGGQGGGLDVLPGTTTARGEVTFAEYFHMRVAAFQVDRTAVDD